MGTAACFLLILPVLVLIVEGRPIVLLGQTESCKSVSIPAVSECAPGLVCNPHTGTCVPAAGFQFRFISQPTNYQPPLLPTSNDVQATGDKEVAVSLLYD